MSMLPPESDNKPSERELRDAALALLRLSANRYHPAERALGYFLQQSIAHGCSLDEVAAAAGVDQATVQRLTDPQAAS